VKGERAHCFFQRWSAFHGYRCARCKTHLWAAFR